MTEAVRADHLSKTYGQGPQAIRAMQDVSLVAHHGEVLALVGPSGSGKSTLLTALGLLNLPDSGQIYLDGRLIVDGSQPQTDLAAIRRSRIGFVFQRANLIPFLTAKENVLLALSINDRQGAAAEARAAELLDYLGLADRGGHYPDELSGGQAQRIAIARALALAPPVILADEPTAALDSHRTRSVMALFRRIAHEQGTAVVVVTHDHRTLDLFDTVYEMEDGVLGPGTVPAGRPEAAHEP
jgi:putative ABC transport system ATP-binding protein